MSVSITGPALGGRGLRSGRWGARAAAMVAVAGLVGSLGVLPAAAAEPFAAVGVWQDTEEWLYDAEGRQILLEVRPELTVGACFDYDPMGQVSAQFSLEGSDGQVVAGSTGAFAMKTDGYG